MPFLAVTNVTSERHKNRSGSGGNSDEGEYHAELVCFGVSGRAPAQYCLCGQSPWCMVGGGGADPRKDRSLRRCFVRQNRLGRRGGGPGGEPQGPAARHRG